MLAYRALAQRYVRRLEDAFGQRSLLGTREPIVDVEAETAMLRTLIFQIIVGDQEEDDEAETIQGPSDPFQQAFGRDSKLMDALVDMIQAPQACGLDLRYDEGAQRFADPRFATLAGVHRLACKALTHLFLGNPANEEYFARQSVQVASSFSTSTESVEWVSVLIKQVPYPVGAAECLTALISNNARLLEAQVDEKTVEFFEKLIGDQGPYASYLRYFAGICSCRGSQILSNQELVHKAIWCNANKRKALVVEHLILHVGEPAQRWESRSDQQHLDKHKSAPDRGAFLGRAQHEAGFPQVYVHWSGNAEWKPQTRDLFYSPEALGIEPQTERVGMLRRKSLGDKKSKESVEEVSLVKLEDLCWVLDPQKLMKEITGLEYNPDHFEWKTVDEIVDDEEFSKEGIIKLKKQFDGKKQLALYLEAQIDLFAEMCLGRSYNVIEMLRETYTYEMLVGLAANSRLPDQIRASYLGLLQRLWLDVFPHEPNVGRQQFPGLVWVFPLLGHRRVKDAGALPAFRLPPAHPLHADHYAGPEALKEFMTFPDANKFHLVEDFLSDFFIDLNGCQVFKDREKNVFTLAVLRAMRDLISFGFYGTYEEIKDVCNPMISVLDGRQDVKQLRLSGSLTEAQVEPFENAGQRYKLDEDSALVMSCKESICLTLRQVGRLRANYAIGEFLADFKGDIAPNSHGGFPSFGNLLEFRHGEDEGSSQAVDAFKKLFKTEDLLALDLDCLSEAPLDTILLDLLMYESDDLFQSALGLLEARHTQKRKLLDYLKQVTLVPQQELPIYGSFEKLDLEVSMLRNFLQSSEVWGVANEFSDLDEGIFEKVHRFIAKATRFLVMDEDSFNNISSTNANGKETASGGKEESKGDGDNIISAGTPSLVSPKRRRSSSVFSTTNLAGTHEEDENKWEKLLAMEVNTYNQDLLFQLDLHSVLLRAIETDPVGSRSRGKPHLWDVVYDAIRCLTLLVKNNQATQKKVFEALPRFQRLLRGAKDGKQDPRVSGAAATLIVETIRGNAALCERTDRSLFHDFAQELARERDVGVLDFFFTQIVPEGEVIARNQNLSLSVLLALRDQVLDAGFRDLAAATRPKGLLTSAAAFEAGQEVKVTYQVAMLDVLSECAKAQNAGAVGKLQKELSSELLTTTLFALLDPSTAQSSGDTAASVNPAVLDPLPRKLLKALVQYVDIVFFDTPLQEPGLATAADVQSVVGWLAALLPRLTLREEESPVDCQLGQVVLSCLKSYLCCVQNTTKLQTTAKEVYDRISKPLHAVLKDSSIMFQLRSIAYDALATVKVEQLDKELSRAFETESTEAFQLGAAEPGGLDRSAASAANKGWGVFSGRKQRGGGGGGGEADLAPGQHSSSRANLNRRLAEYVREVEENEDVQKGFLEERMRMVDLLEHVEILTDPGDEDDNVKRKSSFVGAITSVKEIVKGEEDNLPEIIKQQLKQAKYSKRTNKVGFDALVGRMRAFVAASLRDRGRAGACLAVLDLLRLHLARARRRIDEGGRGRGGGQAGAIEDLDRRAEAAAAARAAHRARQDRLVRLGWAGTVYEAVCADPDSALSEAALQLGREMLCFGNKTVQEGLLHYAKKKDANGRFFKNMRDRLRESREEIRLARKILKTRKEFYKPPQASYAEATSVMGFLQELCEGHYRPMQELLRAQEFNRKSYDLVAEVAAFLEAVAKDQIVLRYMEDDELKVVIKALNCLVEVMQGPCDSNQKFVADSRAVNCCKTILSNSSFRKLKKPLLGYEAKTKALLCLASCLEGRTDWFVHTKFARTLEPGLLDSAVMDLSQTLEDLQDELDRKNQPIAAVPLQGKVRALTDDSVTSKDLEDFIQENVDSAALYLFTIRTQLATIPSLSVALKPPTKFSKEKEFYENYQLLWRRLGSVEVAWMGRTTMLLFPMPGEARSLTQTTKEDFLAAADLETQESRLKSLMEASPALIDEMKVLDSLKDSKSYMFVKENYKRIKYFNFFIAIILNLLMLLSLENSSGSHRDFILFNTHTEGAEYLMMALAIIALLGYGTVIVYFMVSQFQLVWMAHKRLRRASKETEEKHIVYFDFTPLKLWTITLAGFIIICCVHSVGFEKVDADLIVNYVTFGAVVLGLSLIKALRTCVIIPRTLHSQVLTATYDVVTDPKAALSSAMLLFTALGFWHELFFSFLLFDIISLSEDLKNVVRAIVRPIKALVLTACLFVVVILVFSMIGYSAFGEDRFCEGDCDDDNGQLSPVDSLGVFFTIINQGIRYGDIGDIMAGVNHEMSLYYSRIFYQLAFFIVIGVLLFDMVTGIILDTFGSLREETADRNDKLMNEGFISGVTRETYDDAGLNFELLNKRDQNVWNYVFFLLYLNLKDEQDYSGGEHHVAACVKRGDFGWFPTRTSFALQERNVQVEEEETLSEKMDRIQAETNAHFKELSRQIEALAQASRK